MIDQPNLEYYLEDEEMRRRHEESKPPVEAYLYIPSSTDIVLFDPKNPKKMLRRVFEMKYEGYKDFELEKMKELDEEIQKLNKKNSNDPLIFPQGCSLYEKFRYLQATAYDCAQTVKLLKENIRWRAQLIPPKISSKVVELLNCGFMYIHGRDNCFRPVLVLNAGVYMKLKDKHPFEEWLNCVIFFMEYLINNLLIPGQIENWNIITDLGGVSLIFLPGDLKKIMGVLQSNYRCRLYVNFIIGMSTILRGIWAFVKSFLDETTVKKIRFLNDDTMSEIFEFINRDQVEERFGGTAKNIVAGGNRCFPPIMPNNNCGRTNNTVLISEEKYKEMHLKNQLTVTGDYYLKKWEREELEMQIKQQEEKRLQEEREFQEQAKVNNANLITCNVFDEDSEEGKNPESSYENHKGTSSTFKSEGAHHNVYSEFTLNTKKIMNGFKTKSSNGGLCRIFGSNITTTTPEIIPSSKSKK